MSLPFPIYKEISIESYRIVILNIDKAKPTSPYINRNVICVDKNNNILWQIEELSKFPGERKYCPYTELHHIEGQLIILNWCDIRLIVDYRTGRILEQKEVR